MHSSIKNIPVLLCLVSNVVTAATLIDVQSGPDGHTQVMMDGNQSRIDMGKGQGYMLIDYEKQTMVAVMPEQEQILDMSGELPSLGGKSAPKIKTELLSVGSGPTIAGYATEIFTVKANGKVCGTLFGSKAAMQTTGISRLFDSMKTMADKQRAAMGGYAGMIDVCTRVNMDFASQSDRVGVPMKMLDDNGKTVSEINSININATLPANVFTLPQDYKTVSLADQMNQVTQGVSQAKRQMPDMDQMMQQMQQSGRVPPEAMEQMKRYQEMMQQNQ